MNPMKIFIWEYVKELTHRWHSGGGLVVIAKDEERARVLASEYIDKEVQDEPYINLPKDKAPDLIFEIANSQVEEKVVTFPNAGCC